MKKKELIVKISKVLSKDNSKLSDKKYLKKLVKPFQKFKKKHKDKSDEMFIGVKSLLGVLKSIENTQDGVSNEGVSSDEIIQQKMSIVLDFSNDIVK
jgi:hypothetical protein